MQVIAASAMSEAELERAVRRMCGDFGLLAYHTHDSRRSAPGFPDWVIVGRRVLWRELKAQHGRLSGPQSRWIHALTAAGQDARVWRPADLLDGTVGRELAGVSGTSSRTARGSGRS